MAIGTRKVILAACVALVVVALGLVITQAKSRDNREEPSIAISDSTPNTCDIYPTREPCQDIEVAGVMWRYALLPAQGRTRETVIVDFGGPGHSVLSGTANLAGFKSDYKELSDRFNLLVLEEPWVTQEVKQQCDHAMTEFYLGLRNGDVRQDGPARSMARECELGSNQREWGFSQNLYPQLVNAVIQRHNLLIKGFIGHSWGSVRLAYLGGPSVDWAILVRPFPLGATAQELVAERARVMQSMHRSLRRIEASEIDGRSIPVTSFDQRSAVVELAYVDDRYFADHATGVLGGTDRAAIGKLSDMLWGRYGRASISPARLAQWQEVCDVVGPAAKGAGRGDPLAEIVALTFAACRERSSNRLIRFTAQNTCFVTSSLDGVAPERLIRRSFQNAGGSVSWVESKARSHGSFDGLSECLRRVQTGR